MKFAHKQTGVNGGTQIVTVTEHNGKGLVKITVIPTEHSKLFNLPFKQLVKLVESSNEKYLYDYIRKMEATK